MARVVGTTNYLNLPGNNVGISGTATPLFMSAWVRVPVDTPTGSRPIIFTGTFGSFNNRRILYISGTNILATSQTNSGNATNAVVSFAGLEHTWFLAAGYWYVSGANRYRAAYVNSGSSRVNDTTTLGVSAPDDLGIGNNTGGFTTGPDIEVAYPTIWQSADLANIDIDAVVDELASGIHPKLVLPQYILESWDLLGYEPEIGLKGANWTTIGTPAIVGGPPVFYPKGSSFVAIGSPFVPPTDNNLEFHGSIPLQNLSATLNSITELNAAGTFPLQSLVATIKSITDLNFAGSIPQQTLAANLKNIQNLQMMGAIPLQTLAAALIPDNTNDLGASLSIPLQTLSGELKESANLNAALSIPLQTLSAAILSGVPDNYQAFYKLWNFRARLDVKLEMDSGNIEADENDVNGTFVAFNKAFKDVNSITVSALATTEIVTIYDFVDVPNPVGFFVYAFDASGNRVTATVSWKARGVL